MLVRYKVDLWDGITNKVETSKGIASVEGTIGSQVARIYSFYGFDKVISVETYELDEIITDEEIKQMFQEDNN